MPVTIKPNGKPGHSEVELSHAAKWIAGILASLIVIGTVGTITLHARVAVIESEMMSIKRHVEDDSVDANLNRIRDEIERYHRGDR